MNTENVMLQMMEQTDLDLGHERFECTLLKQ
jgi:hypothetical protein